MTQETPKKPPIDVSQWHQRHADLFVTTFQHEDFFKELLLAGLKPHILALLDLDTLRLERDAMASKRGYTRRADLVFSVQLKNSKKRIRIALLVEHKSYRDHGLVWQLLVYIVGLRETYPSIIPIVVTHSPMKLNDALADEGRSTLGLPPVRVPFFHIVLSELEWSKLQNLSSAAAMIILGHTKDFETLSHEKKLQLITQALQSLPKLGGPDHKLLLQKLFDYIRVESPPLFKMMGAKKMILDEQDLEPHIIQQIEEGLDMVEEAKDLWFDEKKFIKQGVAQGLEQGLEQGREEGAAEARRQMVANLLSIMAPEKISQHCKLPIDLVLEVQQRQDKK